MTFPNLTIQKAKYYLFSDHFTHTLRCKRNCMKKLSLINGNVYEDLLPSHYNYLQYAYYKCKDPKTLILSITKNVFVVRKLNDACRAVASYLLFYPDDLTMKNNMEYYMKLPKVDKSYFAPRQVRAHCLEKPCSRKFESFVHQMTQCRF